MTLPSLFRPLWLATLVVGSIARADEPLFGYAYTTDLLPKGQTEIEQWVTWRHGKSQGSFEVFEGRTELSYGVTDAFQLSLYANYNKTTAKHDGVDGQTAIPESFAGQSFDPDRRFNAARFVGFSLEGIYRLLSPYTDPIGLAVYFEPTVGNRLLEFESRIILQKNFLDDRLVFAFNLLLEQELRHVPGDPTVDPESVAFNNHWDKETDVNLSFGASYRFAPNWSAGLEIQNEREFSRLVFWNGKFATNSAVYAGPNIHYGGRNFFFTLLYTEQLPLAKDYANDPPGFLVHGRTYADDFEKRRLRLKLGYYF